MKYYWFLLLTVLLSIPFYIWGAVSPVTGLPFGLPISFLMIFVPFFLALAYARQDAGRSGIAYLFTSIFDYKKSKTWAALFCLMCMPVALILSYVTMSFLPLPQAIIMPWRDVPVMMLIYFLGAIPEEFGWTMTVTKPLTAKHGPVGAGILIGLVWAIWHVIPWSWAHDFGWIVGMLLLNVLMRIGMVLAFTQGGASLFYAVVFHALINVSIGVFPNDGSHTNPWLISPWILITLAVALYFQRRERTTPQP